MGKRVAIMTDAHANLPALQAALTSIEQEGCDAIFHTGDAIGIGPHPAECLDLLLTTPKLTCLMGNHDAWFAFGSPTPQPAWMSDGEVVHQQWTHTMLDDRLRATVARWPYTLTLECGGVNATLLHYALTPAGNDFLPIVTTEEHADIEGLFAAYDTQLVFYGHHHQFSDIRGHAHYINPGSLGCWDRPVARYTMIECAGGYYTVEHRQVPYDDTSVYSAFEEREVPERHFIYRAFFGGRFPTHPAPHM